MPVTTTHASYDDMLASWRKCRDFAQGEKAVKGRREAYLPRLELDSDARYVEYLDRTEFYAGTTRAVDALVGALFSNDPKLTQPESASPEAKAISTFVADVTGDGLTFQELCRQAGEEQFIVGRAGILIDADSTPTGGELPRPYAILYRAEQIINWRTKIVGSRPVLTMVVLREVSVEDDPADPFATKVFDQWRVLELRGYDTPTPKYVVTVWKRPAGEQGDPVEGETVEPNVRGKTFDAIPFVFVGSKDTTPEVDPIPIEGVVAANLAHYQLSADYYRTLHQCGSSTPYIFGIKLPEADENGNKPTLKLGSFSAIISEEADATCGFLALDPDQIAPLKDAREECANRMAELSGRLLETKGDGQAETATAIQMRQGGQRSVLATASGVLTKATTGVLQWVALWLGIAENGTDYDACGCTINRDFDQAAPDATLVTAVNGAYVGGSMSLETAAYNYEQLRLLPPDVTAEDEVERIKAAAPPAPVPAVPTETLPVAA